MCVELVHVWGRASWDIFSLTKYLLGIDHWVENAC